MVDCNTELQQVESSRVVAAVDAETVDTVVTSDAPDPFEEGLVIGDLYVSCRSVAPEREATPLSGGIGESMELPCCGVDDPVIQQEMTTAVEFSATPDCIIELDSDSSLDLQEDTTFEDCLEEIETDCTERDSGNHVMGLV